MICLIKRPLKSFIWIALVFSGVEVNAQVSLVQNVLDKIESYKNFSYQSVYKQKDYTSDTTIIQRKDIFAKAPEDKTFGYLFSMENFIVGNKSPYTDLYNGQNLIELFPEDSTYIMKQIQVSAVQGSLLGYLKILEGLFEKRPSQMDPDTTIDGNICSHLILNTYDTTIDKEHYYTRIHVFINKLSGMPDRIMAKSRNARVGNGITNYYMEYRYSNYKFDQDNIDIASMTFPKGFHPPKEHAAPLLASGKAAPDWVLYSAEGKKVSLAQMKGKVVVLDFFFIGCEGCMLALKPMNKLHEKYKNQDVAMLSMTFRDSKESVMEFKKHFNIKYPVYINAGDVVKLYNVGQFPTFYFIDKEGKIANVVVGYSEDLEEKVSSVIDKMLGK